MLRIVPIAKSTNKSHQLYLNDILLKHDYKKLIIKILNSLTGRMSDHCEAVRIMSTRCFASLIQLMPLDGAVSEPPDLTPDLKARRRHDKQFLEQLFNPKSIKDYKIPVPVSAELRSYQQVSKSTIF